MWIYEYFIVIILINELGRQVGQVINLLNVGQVIDNRYVAKVVDNKQDKQ